MVHQPLANGRPSPGGGSATGDAEYEAPLFEIIEFTFSDRNSDSEFIVISSGKRFIIRLFEDRFSEAPHLQERYLFFLRVAEEGGELDGHTLEDFEDWVMDPFLPMFRSLPQSDPNLVANKTLDDFLFAETLTYIVGADAGHLSPIRCETTQSDRSYIGLGIRLPDDVYSSWPCYRPSEIELCHGKPDRVL